MNIAVWFSAGAASAVAAKLTLENYPRAHVRILNSPIAEEDEDNRRFLMDVQRWLGVEIELVTNENYPTNSAVDVWRKRQFMSGPKGAPCTLELKKKARYQWEERNPGIDWHVLGFTYDEQDRHKKFILTEKENTLPVLIDAKITKSDCFKILRDAGIELPRIYKLGYPNANCIGCVKATSPTYWNHVRRQHPDVFADRARQSREIGCRLVRVKDVRIFLDELDPEAKGRSMKNMDFDCGIFCEEKKL